MRVTTLRNQKKWKLTFIDTKRTGFFICTFYELMWDIYKWVNLLGMDSLRYSQRHKHIFLGRLQPCNLHEIHISRRYMDPADILDLPSGRRPTANLVFPHQHIPKLFEIGMDKENLGPYLPHPVLALLPLSMKLKLVRSTNTVLWSKIFFKIDQS